MTADLLDLRRALARKLSPAAREKLAQEIEVERVMGSHKLADALEFLVEYHDRAHALAAVMDRFDNRDLREGQKAGTLSP